MSKFAAVFKAKQEQDAQEDNQEAVREAVPEPKKTSPAKNTKDRPNTVSGAQERSLKAADQSLEASQPTSDALSHLPMPAKDAPRVPITASTSTTTVQGVGRRPGRPNAKRSDPNFVQTTAYIRKKTHKDVKSHFCRRAQTVSFLN